jgi:hypothetical protein
LDFVTGKINRTPSLIIVASSVKAGDDQKSRIVRRRESLNRDEAERILLAALDEFPAPSLQNVAARLGRDGNTLRYWFPEICKEIVEKHARYKKAQDEENWEEVGSTLSRMLTEENPPPSMAEAARRLGYDIKTLKKHFPDICREISIRRSVVDCHTHIRITLEIALSEAPPPSVSGLARREGLSRTTLYKYFPELCHTIAESRAGYIKSNRGLIKRKGENIDQRAAPKRGTYTWQFRQAQSCFRWQ